MPVSTHPARRPNSIRRILFLAVAGILTPGTQLAAGERRPATGRDGTAGAVEIRLADDSTLKAVLRDGRIEIETRYGKLLIPTTDIHRIEFGLRLGDDVRVRIEAAVADLGHKEYRRRQAATAFLLALREKAYPTLLRAARGKDQEAAHRAEQLLEKIREAVPAERLEVRPYDVVYTEDSQIAGRITTPALRVRTLAFGEQELRLADVLGLRSLAAAAAESAPAALPDPGTLMPYQGQVGKTLAFRVTGPPPALAAQTGVYGTDVYTLDSNLALAAVHAGVVRPGETRVVRVTVLGPQPGFQASVRNGVASAAYGPWAGFRVEPRSGPGRRKE
jgi:hypothetical protein